MDGGFFLIQHVNLQEQGGQQPTGIEMIGHLCRYGEEPSTHIHSRSYDSTGDTLDYVYEMEGSSPSSLANLAHQRIIEERSVVMVLP